MPEMDECFCGNTHTGRDHERNVSLLPQGPEAQHLALSRGGFFRHTVSVYFCIIMLIFGSFQ